VSHTIFVGVFFLLSISYTGATYSNNYALSFDGVNDIVKIGHMYTDLQLKDFWTAEAWIKPFGNQANNYQPNIVGFPGRHPNLEFCGTSPTQPGCDEPIQSLAQLRERNGAYYTMVGQKNKFPDTTHTWYHFAASWNNQTLATYINGELDVSTLPYSRGYLEPLNCTFPLCDEGVDIGGYRFLSMAGTYYSGQYYTGLIDEVRVWNVGRSEDQIKSTMSTVLSGGEPGLLYYWRFDEGKGLLVDSLAFPSYGTLGGGIVDAEPKWVISDSPLTNDYPPTPDGGGSVPCNAPTPNESGLYATAAILSVLFVLGGIFFGIVGYRRYQGREYKQLQ